MEITFDHVALWTNDLERLRTFYCSFFQAECGEKYRNNKKEFESYFLTFANHARIEIMSVSGLEPLLENQRRVGIAHLALHVGSGEHVELLTKQIKDAGYTVLSEPRITGDGYYESTILDPDNNLIEIVA